MRDSAPSQGARRPLIVVLLLVPITALGLYMISGHPDMPSAPPVLQAEQREAQEEQMLDQLRHAIAEIDPHSPRAREGNSLLASIDESRGDFAGAASAWKAALVSGFDPLIAAHAAEAATRAEGHVSPESAALFRQALAAAPPDAPWRDSVEKRLAEQ